MSRASAVRIFMFFILTRVGPFAVGPLKLASVSDPAFFAPRFFQCRVSRSSAVHIFMFLSWPGFALFGPFHFVALNVAFRFGACVSKCVSRLSAVHIFLFFILARVGRFCVVPLNPTACFSAWCTTFHALVFSAFTNVRLA